MCKMNIVLNKLVLGNRELGYELWNGTELVEATSKTIKDMINSGKKVCGLTIKNGELVLDEEGFYTTNLMVHSHIGSWKPLADGSLVNKMYVCIGKHEENGTAYFDCISNRFEQAKFDYEEMLAYLKIGVISGGAKISGKEIILADLEFKTEEKEKSDSALEVKPENEDSVKTAEPLKAEEAVTEEKKEVKKSVTK